MYVFWLRSHSIVRILSYLSFSFHKKRILRYRPDHTVVTPNTQIGYKLTIPPVIVQQPHDGFEEVHFPGLEICILLNIILPLKLEIQVFTPYHHDD